MKVIYFKTLPSTSQKAKEIAKEKPEPWLVIVAEEQTAGYGRKQAIWYSPLGGLYFSVVLPKSKIEDLQTLTILAAFVIAKVIKDYYPASLYSQPTQPKKDNLSFEPVIKLPNDIYLNNKKVCGILTENVIGKDIRFSVIGIGLNTNIKEFPKELQETATSLKIELGKTVNNSELLQKIVRGLKEQLKTISE